MERIKKICEAAQKQNFDYVVLNSVANVTYASETEIPLHMGPIDSIANEMPCALVIIRVDDQKVYMLADAGMRTRIETAGWPENVWYFTVWADIRPNDPAESFRIGLRALLDDVGFGGAKCSVGIEIHTLPYLVWDVLRQRGELSFADVSGVMYEARKTKTAGEISTLREIAAIMDVGQQKFNEMMTGGGFTEFDLYYAILNAMSDRAGATMPVTGELVVGQRTCEVKWPGGPLKRQVMPGDIAILDISPRIYGYWGDCANVAVCGGNPNEKQKHYVKVVTEVYDELERFLKPGVRCDEAFELIRKCYAKYDYDIPHYCGHQIGIDVNERPRLVPYEKAIIEENMVFCMELGLYEGQGGDTGVRCEKMMLIHKDGCELMNQFHWGVIP